MSNFSGTERACDLSPPPVYDYRDTMDALMETFGFRNLGEGGFGVILGGETCVIKLIKDLARCDELKRETQVYQTVEAKSALMSRFGAAVPRYHLFAQFVSFCHFNMQRIYSPLSGYGDIESDVYGHGYVVDDDGDGTYTMIEDGSGITTIRLPKEQVYSIGRPGKLVHFFINHFDPNLRESLDNYQGVLLGRQMLERSFGTEHVTQYMFDIGQLLGFLVFQCNVVPTDIEVLGSTNRDNRVVRPFIYDFNECTFFRSFDPATTPLIIAQSIRYKNGKYYFPDRSNPYFVPFTRGFVNGACSDGTENNLYPASLVTNLL